MCGESAGFVIKSDYGGACGLGFEKKVFFDGARARCGAGENARARCEVFFDGAGARCGAGGNARARCEVFFDGARARCGAGENARAGAEMVIKCEMGMIRF